MLYQCFVKEMVLKCGCWIEFSSTILSTMRAYMYMCVILFIVEKLDEDSLLNNRKDVLKNSKVGFYCCSC